MQIFKVGVEKDEVFIKEVKYGMMLEQTNDDNDYIYDKDDDKKLLIKDFIKEFNNLLEDIKEKNLLHINKLKKSDRVFFMPLYKYNIIDDCKLDINRTTTNNINFIYKGLVI